MPVPVEITTIGARVRYRVEIERNVRPTENFIDLLGVSSAPAFDMTPEVIDISTLADYYTQFLAGRQNPGEDAQFILNHSEQAIDAWNALCEASRAGLADGKRTWFEYSYQNGSRSYFFCGQPLPLGNGGIEQNTVDTIPAHVIPCGRFGWYSASTYNIAYIGTDDKFYLGTDNQFYVGTDNQIFADR
jgi:hypothetical protein